MLSRGGMPISGTQAAVHFQAAGYTELPVVNAHIAMLETLPPITQTHSTACWWRKR